jgi:enterochelin esterase family protein
LQHLAEPVEPDDSRSRVPHETECLCFTRCSSAPAFAQETAPLTPKSLQAALAAKPEGAEAEKLAERIRAYFGGSESLLKGAPPKIDELTVAWAVEAPQLAPNVTPRVMADAGALNVPMVKVGASGLYAVAVNLSHGAALTWHYELGPDRRLGGSQIETYETPPDSRARSEVPKGTVKQMPPWQSKIFEGTTRDWWVTLARTRREPGGGHGLSGRRRTERLPADGLRQPSPRGIPVMVVSSTLHPRRRGPNRLRNDTLSDQYARFLLERSCRKSKTVKLRPTPQAARSPAQAAAASARSPSRGSGRTN